MEQIKYNLQSLSFLLDLFQSEIDALPECNRKSELHFRYLTFKKLEDIIEIMIKSESDKKKIYDKKVLLFSGIKNLTNELMQIRGTNGDP